MRLHIKLIGHFMFDSPAGGDPYNTALQMKVKK